MQRVTERYNLVIDHEYTVDRVEDAFENGQLVGWDHYAVHPAKPGMWTVFDRSPDTKTGWRRIRLVRV